MSSFIKKAPKALIVIGAAAALTLVAPLAAQADPPASPQRTYQAAGSDTIEQLAKGYTLGYFANGANRGPFATSLGSWDAFGPKTNHTTEFLSQIQPKSTGATFYRPAGSGEGIKALSASWNPGTSAYTVLRDLNDDGDTTDPGESITTNLQQGGQHEIDVARSSSRPATSAGVGTANDKLVYYPVARDAVSAAFQQGASPVTINGLTTAALTFIYNAGSTGTFTGSGFTISAGSGSTDPVYTAGGQNLTLHPILPQASSGTRSFFLNSIGVTSIGSWVQQGVEENDGSVLATAGDIVPFSAAVWIAQKNGNDNVTFGGSSTVKLLNIDSKSPTTGTAPSLLPDTNATSGLFGDPAVAPASPTLGNAVYARDVYLVVPSSVFDSTGANFDPTLVGIVQNLRTQNYAASGTKFVTQDYGFARLTYTVATTGLVRGPFTNP